jgi:hypothetical protein
VNGPKPPPVATTFASRSPSERADLEDERFDAPEARGIDVVIRGLSMVCEDEEMLELTARLYDGLYEHWRRATLLGRDSS